MLVAPALRALGGHWEVGGEEDPVAGAQGAAGGALHVGVRVAVSQHGCPGQCPSWSTNRAVLQRDLVLPTASNPTPSTDSPES